MATVHEWFCDFEDALRDRSLRSDWPETGSEYWRNFEKKLVEIGARWEVADEAISAVCDLPGLFPDQFRPKIIEAIKAIDKRLIDAERLGGGASTLDAAKLASKDCPDCGGSGWAIRYVHADVAEKFRTALGNEVPVGYSASFPCSCSLGVFQSASIKPPNGRKALTIDQYPTLRRDFVHWHVSAPDGKDNRYRYHPDNWNAIDERPVDLPDPGFDLNSLKALGSSLRLSRTSGRRNIPPHPNEGQGEPAKALPARPGIAAGASDPIVARELASRTPQTPSEPENPDYSGWF